MSNKNKSDLLKLIDRLTAEDRMNGFLAEIEGRAQEPSDDLVQRTSERILSAIREFDAREAVAAASPDSSSLVSIAISKLSDLYAALPRLFFVDVRIGAVISGLADDGARRFSGEFPNTVHFCTWKQDTLQFTLSCLKKKPYTVTLHVDEGPNVELSDLCWIDEDTLLGHPNDSVDLQKFLLKRIDERTYRVPEMDVVTFAARMGSINAARERSAAEGVDIRTLLPFVN